MFRPIGCGTRRAHGDFMHRIGSDITYALRLIRRRPAPALLVTLAVALGVGVNTAIFSVVNAVLLTPLPYPKPGEIVRLYSSQPERDLTFFSVPPADYLDWKRDARSFALMGAFSSPRSVGLTSVGEPAQVMTARVSGDLFRVLGVSPAMGRLYSTEEQRGADVAVVSHAFWKARLAGRPDIVGSTMSLDGKSHLVVGVMPEGFTIPGSPAQIWTPLALSPVELGRGNRFLRVLARLAPGATPATAQSEMEQIARTLAAQYPGTNDRWTARVRTLRDLVIGERFVRAVLVLAGAVGFILLIACANVANLLLAQRAGRTREMATRAALGASRGRLIGQLLVESLVLAVAGGALGLLLALWGVDILKSMGSGSIPRLETVSADGRVLGFSAGLTLLTGLIFGLLPAIHAARPTLTTALKDAADPVRQRLRGALVVVEIALALVLLVGAGLMIRSVDKLLRVPLGFDPTRVVAVLITLSPMRYGHGDQITAFHQQLAERVSGLAGVRSVGAIDSLPMDGLNASMAFRREGRSIQDEAAAAPTTDYRVATASYFEAMRIPLLRGRLFTADDRPGGERAILVSDTAARRYWPDADPIGQRIEIGDLHSARAFRIVGVVGDVRHFGPEDVIRPMMYVSHAQNPARTMVLVVNTTAGTDAAARTLRAAVWSIDREQPIGAIQPVDDLVSAATAQRRFNRLLLTVFGALALTLAAVGVYGVMSYSVSTRTREIGLRLALGATKGDVMRLVLREGLALAAGGVAIGLGLGLWLAKTAQSMVFEIEPRDPITFVSVAILLSAVALAACYVPARRATKADPALALKAE
jgi:predicted permease